MIHSHTVRLFFTAILIVIPSLSQAQSVLTPGQNVLDKKWIKNGTYEMGCYADAGGKQVEISSFTVKINSENNQLGVYTALRMTGSNDVSIDTSI